MNYTKLMEKSDLAYLKAMNYWFKGDNLLASFWKNVSIGYKHKALTLEITIPKFI